MKKIKIIGSWEKTFIVENSITAIQLAKDLADKNPHLNMKVAGINHLGSLNED